MQCYHCLMAEYRKTPHPIFMPKIFKFLEAKFPTVRKWTLNTPAWAHRNRHFYEKLGYVKVHEETLEDGGILVFYEKTI